MFDIENLITKSMQTRLDSIKNTDEQAVFLLRLIDFEANFKDDAVEIAKLWFENTQERYSSGEHYIDDDTKALIYRYARFTGSIEKVKNVINKLLSIDDGVYDYDSVIAEMEEEMLLLRNIDDFEFSNGSKTRKRAKSGLKSIGDIMEYKKLEKPKGESKRK